MKLFHLEQGMMRTPSFSQDHELVDVWEELKEKIQYASPEFYKFIKGMNYLRFIEAPEKIRFTVWKYFNRSKYRATQFAELAAFSTIEFENSFDKNVSIEIKRKLLNHHSYVGVQINER